MTSVPTGEFQLSLSKEKSSRHNAPANFMYRSSNRADIPAEGKSAAPTKPLLGTKCLFKARKKKKKSSFCLHFHSAGSDHEYKATR